MIRRLRLDRMPIWPVPAGLALGGALIAAGRLLDRWAQIVDDAHDINFTEETA